MDCNMPGLPVPHCLSEFAQVHVHWVSDAIQPSHPLPPSSPFAFNLSKHQGLFQWVSSWHQMAKELELQLQHQSFQWEFNVEYSNLCISMCTLLVMFLWRPLTDEPLYMAGMWLSQTLSYWPLYFPSCVSRAHSDLAAWRLMWHLENREEGEVILQEGDLP